MNIEDWYTGYRSGQIDLCEELLEELPRMKGNPFYRKYDECIDDVCMVIKNKIEHIENENNE